jgi:hypothetical protein
MHNVEIQNKWYKYYKSDMNRKGRNMIKKGNTKERKRTKENR